ncbi:hypothetical protein KC19_3G190600 [Ceratodon purpureus]|uniref:Uncharacterized protein n=1 Tax=Ceratodon purpureus TaxID=3225 RepID=A0A8T0IMC8_CERPU|nr:hypothetical protein KC19_3G190600 [Ceratodon purpureus]
MLPSSSCNALLYLSRWLLLLCSTQFQHSPAPRSKIHNILNRTLGEKRKPIE